EPILRRALAHGRFRSRPERGGHAHPIAALHSAPPSAAPEHVSYPHINVAGCSRRLVVPGLRRCCAEPAPAPAWGRNPASAPGDTAPDKPSPPPSAPNHVGRL